MYDQSCEGVCSFVFIRDSMCGEDVFNEWFNPNEACFLIILPRQSLFTGHKQRFIHTHVTRTPPIGMAKTEVFMNLFYTFCFAPPQEKTYINQK